MHIPKNNPAGENRLSVSYKLEYSEALELTFHAFLRHSPILAWVIDEKSRLLFATRSFFDYFGIDEKSSINKYIFELVPGVVYNALKEKHYQVIHSGLPAETTEIVRLADGSNYIFHVNIFPIEGGNGCRMAGGHAVNIEEKHAIQKQLQESNDRLLLLTRATSDAIWEWDMQTGHIFRNDALMEMVGYQFENAKGLSWWLRRIHPEDRNRVTDKIKDATDHGQQSWEETYRFKCADGSYKHIQDHGYVVYENGLPVKMIGSLRDISDLKKLEEQLTEEKFHRQKEISEVVMRVQEKERTRIGLELHDNVNQILATTKLFVDMLRPATKEEMLAKHKSIEYLCMAVEEIRKLSKELVVPQLQGEGLVNSIQSLVNDIQLSNVIKIRFTHDAENELLGTGIKVTLFRIVQEQLKNVLKHSGANLVDIYLENKGGESKLVIRDNGTGFDPRQTTRGIGLSSIHERTRFYNGRVKLETSPGNGCTLTVTIPSEGKK